MNEMKGGWASEGEEGIKNIKLINSVIMND